MPAERRPSAGLAVGLIALLLQVFIALFTAALGLSWSGPWYNASVGQALLGLVVIGWLLRRLVALLIPVLSAGLTYSFVSTDARQQKATGCYPDELAAASTVGSPPGMRLRFHAEPHLGCVARAPTHDPAFALGYYRERLTAQGWNNLEADPNTLTARAGPVLLVVDVDMEEAVLVISIKDQQRPPRI